VTDKGLVYAESTLGVNSVYEEVKKARNDLDECLARLSEARDSRRLVESKIEDRQVDIITEEHGKHPDMSVSGMDRHLKAAFGKDPELVTQRSDLRELTNDIEGLDYDRSIMEQDIKIGVARMHELGGYLQFLAALKASKTPSSK
jgi:hypothetical protein